MKKIQAIIRPGKLEALKDVTAKAELGGMTVTTVHGCGTQQGWKEYYRGSEIILNMLPKVQCEFVVEDDKVDEVVDLICDVCQTGEVGDGKIFIIPVDDVIRIRTGERGSDAI